MRTHLCLTALLAALSSPAAGQTPYRTHAGLHPGDQFGQALANVGDLNGDGVDDLAVGMPEYDGGGTDAGGVVALSGADGATLWTHAGAYPYAILGNEVAAAGDVDLDGVPDAVAGGPTYDGNNGMAAVLSGVDGSPLFTFFESKPSPSTRARRWESWSCSRTPAAMTSRPSG